MCDDFLLERADVGKAFVCMCVCWGWVGGGWVGGGCVGKEGVQSYLANMHDV